MKMIRIKKLISVILALLLLSSCAPSAVDSASSAMAKGEEQNQSSIISSASAQDASSEIASSDVQTSSKEKEEQNALSSKPQKEETSSNNSVSSSASTSSAPTSSAPTSSAPTSSEFKPKKFDDLSTEKVNEISAYIKKDNYEYHNEQYFGTYNQYDIVLISQINGVEYEDAKSVKIAGYEFLIGTTEKLIAYKDNSYILLSEAYNKGLITKDDIQNINYYYRYSFYYKFRDDCILVLMKKDVNNPDKEYTAADFPALNIKSIDQSLSLNYEGQEGKLLAIYLPIKNRRNVCNAIEQVKKMEGIIFVEPDHMISPLV